MDRRQGLQEKVREIYIANRDWSNGQIAEHLDVDREYVSAAVRRLGLATRPGRKIPNGWKCPCGHTGHLMPIERND